MAKKKDPRIAQNVARNLMRIREDMGMSQRALSRASDVSQQTIGFLERAENEPVASTLYKLARALGVSADDLIADEKPPEPRFSPIILKGQFRAMMPDESEETADEMVDDMLDLYRETMLSIKKMLHYAAMDDRARRKIEQEEDAESGAVESSSQ